jgi:hypothetical protein
MMEELIGQTIDEYQIVSSLGQGVLGPVFEVRDTRRELDAALKLVDTQIAPDFDWETHLQAVVQDMQQVERSSL